MIDLTKSGELNVLIASTKAPTAENWPEFTKAVKTMAEGLELNFVQIGATDGPHCANIVVTVQGHHGDINHFAKQLTMAMMPARFTFTQDKLEGYHLTK